MSKIPPTNFIIKLNAVFHTLDSKFKYNLQFDNQLALELNNELYFALDNKLKDEEI